MGTNQEKYIRIFATSFLIEDYRQSIEYRLVSIKYGYRLIQRIHNGAGICDYLTDWETLSHYSNLRDAITEIFNRLRTMEIDQGLYGELRGSSIPIDVYSKKINQWVDYANRLDFTFFSIHGNHFKYLPRPSAETKAFHLRVYESLKHHWQVPFVNDLWFEELVKKEISNHNEVFFAGKEVDDMTLPAFLKKYYRDYEDQIDRYLLHLGISDRNIKVTAYNRTAIQRNFEHHLIPETHNY